MLPIANDCSFPGYTMRDLSDLHQDLFPSPAMSYHSLRISISRILIKVPKMQNTLDCFFLLSFPFLFFFSSISSLLGSRYNFQFPGPPRRVVPEETMSPLTVSTGKSRCIPPLGQQRRSFPQAARSLRVGSWASGAGRWVPPAAQDRARVTAPPVSISHLL